MSDNALRYRLPRTGDSRLDDFLEDLLGALERETAHRRILEEEVEELSQRLEVTERAVDRQDGQLSTLETAFSVRGT